MCRNNWPDKNASHGIWEPGAIPQSDRNNIMTDPLIEHRWGLNLHDYTYENSRNQRQASNFSTISGPVTPPHPRTESRFSGEDYFMPRNNEYHFPGSPSTQQRQQLMPQLNLQTAMQPVQSQPIYQSPLSSVPRYPGSQLSHMRSSSYSNTENNYPNISLTIPSSDCISSYNAHRPRAASSSYPKQPQLVPGNSHLEFSQSAFPPPLSSPISPDDGHKRNLSEQYLSSLSSFNSLNGLPPLTPTTPSTPVNPVQPVKQASVKPFGHQKSQSQITLQMQMQSQMQNPAFSVNTLQPAKSFKAHERTRSQPTTNYQPVFNGIPGSILPKINQENRISTNNSSPASSASGASSTSSASKPMGKCAYPHLPGVANAKELVGLVKDQKGCRLLQHKLSEDPKIVNFVFKDLVGHIVDLMTDPFGNYFCQKMFECCSNEQVTRILKAVSSKICNVAVNQYGTRALQMLIDQIKDDNQIGLLVTSLNTSVVRLIRDLNGNHVIQKILLVLPEYGKEFIFAQVCQSIVEVGSHRHGCCVLQRCLAYSSAANRDILVNRIIEESPKLVVDPFGNYVCQYVIDLHQVRFTDAMAAKFMGSIITLSVQKFSSNVIEKVLRNGSVHTKRKIVFEISKPKGLHELLLDNYGNYVVQTALDVSGQVGGGFKKNFSQQVHTALAQTKSPYGKSILSKLH